ncbi:MAG: hypothetical protein CBD16_00205 [Betaproteobacteria bacterium TMED156]|nr:MAG: hypothetical protein CBD16_00205 [Betaproteobacteria bacterium TMED156]
MKKHWLTKKENIKKLWILMIIILFLTIIIQIIFPVHGHFEIEESFAFASWFGFFSCILMIIIAKILGLLIKRPENYYNKNNKIEIDQ